jgi:hypothetical protein
MKALRLPAPASPVAYCFRSRGPRYPRSFVSRRSAPKEARGRLPGLVPCSAGGPLPACPRMDGHGISQVPRRPIPCLCPAPGPRSNQPDLAILRSRRCCPRCENGEGFGGREFRGLPLGFNTCCLRFTRAVASPHAKLASGWLAAFAGGESNPVRRCEGFPSVYIPSFPFLPSWTYPDAISPSHCLIVHLSGRATWFQRKWASANGEYDRCYLSLAEAISSASS